MFIYPAKPWQDGQTITKMIGGREVVVAKYDASKNLWIHLNPNDDGILFYANACQVTLDRSECGGDGKCPPDVPQLTWCDAKNVQYALDWLHYQLSSAQETIRDHELRIQALENE